MPSRLQSAVDGVGAENRNEMFSSGHLLTADSDVSHLPANIRGFRADRPGCADGPGREVASGVVANAVAAAASWEGVSTIENPRQEEGIG